MAALLEAAGAASVKAVQEAEEKLAMKVRVISMPFNYSSTLLSPFYSDYPVSFSYAVPNH